jgi:DNA-binding NtrC family response regulator
VTTDVRVILLADPDPTSRAALCQELEAASYEVRAVATGMEAAEVLMETIPRLVVLDLDLKWMSGRHLIDILKSHVHTARIPVVALTYCPTYLAGIPVLIRPIDPNRLVEIVEWLSPNDDFRWDER